ncbi:MAG: hypothetical protein HZA88_24240 [Verrucomicrobia bacterium]|nr:hypothetical protein [Verrucomicrobiota bacterium]
MKTRNFRKLTFLSTCAAAMLLTGCAVQKETQLQVLRQRFVPVPHDSSCGGGANWTALHRLSDDKPGVLMVMAHAGIGDTFPVQEEHNPKLFDVIVVAGDDEHLMLEVRSEEGSQRLDLRRDGTVWVKVAGRKYSVAYPSVTVSPGSKPTTDKAMILVHRFP